MGILQNPSRKTFVGPWLLDVQALEELDKIIEFADNKLEKARITALESKAREEFEDEKYNSYEEAKESTFKYSYDTIRKNITLISQDESKLTDNTLKEILVDPKLKDFRPKELNIDVVYGTANFLRLSVKQRFDGELMYETESTQSETDNEINYKLENWVDTNKASKIQSLWLKYSFPVFLLGALLSLFFLLNLVAIVKPTAQEIYANEINTLISTGIDESNEYQAIDLLLRINSNYIPNNIVEEKKVNSFAKNGLIITLPIVLFAIFKPKTILGLGKDKKILKLYKQYMKLVLLIIPAIALYPFITDLIRYILSS